MSAFASILLIFIKIFNYTVIVLKRRVLKTVNRVIWRSFKKFPELAGIMKLN